MLDATYQDMDQITESKAEDSHMTIRKAVECALVTPDSRYYADGTPVFPPRRRKHPTSSFYLNKGFLSETIIREALTTDAIATSLSGKGTAKVPVTEKVAQEWAQRICEGPKSLRRIFAGIVLIFESDAHMVARLESFVRDADTGDDDLPFALRRRDGSPLVPGLARRLRQTLAPDDDEIFITKSDKTGAEATHIYETACFSGWQRDEILDFVHYQGVFYSPARIGPSVAMVRQPARLPLIALQSEKWRHRRCLSGPHGIHPDYSELPRCSYMSKVIDFDENSVKVLEHLVKKPHPHVASPVAIYTQETLLGGTSYFITPKAEGNLMDLFAAFSERVAQRHQLVEWISQQCEGLATALRALHLDGTYTPFETCDVTPGVHGHISRENILWYPGCGEEPLGCLKISDYGLWTTSLNWTDHSKDAHRYAPVFLAPEAEWGIGGVGFPMDIWALGCVFLDLCSWALQGGHSVQQPDRNALPERSPHPREGYSERHLLFFWYTKWIEDDNRLRYGVWKMKPETRERLRDLRESPLCSAFFHDLLKLIEDDMLCLEPGDRVDDAGLVERLTRMRIRCQQDTEYAVVGENGGETQGTTTEEDLEPANAVVVDNALLDSDVEG